MNILIDSSYLSFLIGASNYTLHQFFSNKQYSQYYHLLDGPNNVRFKTLPTYKSSRDKTSEIRQRVRQVRHFILDHYLHMRMEGLEADDLIALVHILYPDETFVTFAQDKDMLQIPNVNIIGYSSHGKEKGIKHYYKYAVPKSIAKTGYIINPMDMLLVQSLMGDKTDDIPRVLPKRTFGPVHELLASPNAFEQAYNRYGEPYMQALRCVLLPSPEVCHFPDDDVLLVMALDNYRTYRFKHWTEILEIKSEYKEAAQTIFENTKLPEGRQVGRTPFECFLLEMDTFNYDLVDASINFYKDSLDKLLTV
jgi:hypothetical protein